MVLNTATAFIKRVFCLSHSSFNNENRDTIKRILKKNNFPEKLAEELIRKVLNSKQRSNPQNMVSYPFIDVTIDNTSNCENEPLNRTLNVSEIWNKTNVADDLNDNTTTVTLKKQFMGMTYVAGLTEKLSKSITRTAPNLTIAPRPVCRVGEIFTELKDKIPTEQQSFVVYRVRGQNCGKFYIGETTWCLCDRFKTHESDVKNMAKNPNKTALVKHVFDTGPTHHQFDFERKEILKKVRKKGVLKIQEANQIILHDNQTVNFKSDAAHITPVFYNIIKNNSKRPVVNPQQITSVLNQPDETDVLTDDTPAVIINNNNRNTRTRYNLRN